MHLTMLIEKDIRYARSRYGIPSLAPFRFDLRSSKTAQCVLRLSSSILKRLEMKHRDVEIGVCVTNRGFQRNFDTVNWQI